MNGYFFWLFYNCYVFEFLVGNYVIIHLTLWYKYLLRFFLNQRNFFNFSFFTQSNNIIGCFKVGCVLLNIMNKSQKLNLLQLFSSVLLDLTFLSPFVIYPKKGIINKFVSYFTLAVRVCIYKIG